jgi:hypothetical protein
MGTPSDVHRKEKSERWAREVMGNNHGSIERMMQRKLQPRALWENGSWGHEAIWKCLLTKWEGDPQVEDKKLSS